MGLPKKGCYSCNLYNYSLKRCKDGKVNPNTMKGTLEVMRIMGSYSVCGLNKYRHKAFQRQFNGKSVGVLWHNPGY